MAEIFLGEGSVNDPDGNDVSVSVQMTFPPGFGAASISLYNYFEWQGQTVALGEILQITSRQTDGSDMVIPAPASGTFAAAGAMADPNLSSATFGLTGISVFAQWVLQVIVVP